MMSRLSRELIAAICDWHLQDQDELRAELRLSPEFVGFQGHFPDNPIFPGVCHIQAVVEIASKWLKRKVHLTEVFQAKFFAPVRPNEKLTFSCRKIPQKSGDFMIHAKIVAEGKKAATLKLTVAPQGERS